jgi:hypothetical protein
LLNLPVLCEPEEFYIVRVRVEPRADPKSWRKDPKDAMAVPKATRLRMGRRVGRQHAIKATLVSTIVQKRQCEIMPIMS